MAFYLKCPKIEEFRFRYFVFGFSEFENGKKWELKKSEHCKVGHFEEIACDQLKTENEPKMKLFDFGAF